MLIADRLQATSPFVLRFLLSSAATKVATDGTRRRLIARYDVSMSVYCAPSEGRIAVRPPKDLQVPGVVWYLERAMHGTRKAARLFDAYVIDSFATAGLQQLDYMHMTFVLPELDLEIAVNNEDFVAEGVRESLDALDAIMERFFDVKCLPRIGPPEYGGEVTSGEHLSCVISWTRSGFTCENNLKHVSNLLNLLGFGNDTPGVDTPSVRGKGALLTLDEWLD